MKLSFSTLGCPDWSFDTIMSNAKEMGFDGVELRGVNGVMDAENIPEFSPENAEATKARLAALGLPIVGFGTSVIFHDPKAYDDMVASGKRAIDVCERVRIPRIRVFGDKIERPEDTADVAARVARGIGELCDYAADKGVQVVQEVHGNFNTIEAISRVIDGAGRHPNFGILWDIQHSDKTYGDAWPDFYDVIRPFVRHVHTKDHLRAGFALCLTGEGDLPIPAICKRLLSDGYDGYFSLEWEKKWHPELQEPEVVFPAYVAYMRGLQL